MKNLTPRHKTGLIYAILYLASIILSAWLVVYIGPVPVGFGLYAPAGAYAIGITMTMRDLLQDQLGPKATYAVIILATIISALLSPQVAIASATAFLASETLDLIVYTPIRKKGHLITAIIASNTAGIAVDSFVFLQIAFGDQTFFWGQALAKLAGTIATILILKHVYRNREDMTPAYLKATQH